MNYETESPKHERLVVRCQLGELEAWEEFVDLWQPKMWPFIHRMISDRQRSEDVLQEFWSRVVRSLVALQEPKSAKAWMFSLARRTIADSLRREYRRPIHEQLPDVAKSDDAIEMFERREEVEEQLQRLHLIDREAVVLYYLQGFDLVDVAKMCGVPEGTIKSRLHRARKTIRDRTARRK